MSEAGEALRLRRRLALARRRQRGARVVGEMRSAGAALPSLAAAPSQLPLQQWWGRLEEIRRTRSYPPERLAFDLLEAAHGVCSKAGELCQSLHGVSTLQTNEASESAGPVFFGHYSGNLADLDYTELRRVGGTEALSREHVRLRKALANRLMVTLIAIGPLTTTLPAGEYRGRIFVKASGKTVATIRLIHQRLAKGQRITLTIG